MGRLDDIVARNQNPARHRKGGRFPMGMVVAVFVFVILILMIFTDLDERPDVPKDGPAPKVTFPREKHVDGVLLYRDKPRAARDAGALSD